MQTSREGVPQINSFNTLYLSSSFQQQELSLGNRFGSPITGSVPSIIDNSNPFFICNLSKVLRIRILQFNCRIYIIHIYLSQDSILIMMLKPILLTFLIVYRAAADTGIQPIPSGIPNYNVNIENSKRLKLNKLENETLIATFDHINFELSSKFYFTTGKVAENDQYNPAAYTAQPNPHPIKNVNGNNADNQTNLCSLYPTSMRMTEKKRMFLPLPPVNQIFFLPTPQHERGETINIVAGYLFINTYNISGLQLYKISYTKKGDNKTKFSSANLQKMKPLPVQDNAEEAAYRLFFQLYENCMVVSGKNLYIFEYHSEKLIKIDGYNSSGQRIMSTGAVTGRRIKDTLFFMASMNNLQVYQYHNINKTVEQAWDYSSFFEQTGVKIRSVIYNQKSKFFYATTIDSLIVLEGDRDKLDNNGTVVIKQYQLNGTCRFEGTFLTTMHLICNYKLISYGLELQFEGENVTMNRFYTDWDIEGIKSMINIGNQKMIILGDQKFLVQNYAINRNILLDIGKYQPYQVFPFISGQFIAPIRELSDKTTTTIVAVGENSISLRYLIQDPPELYCTFPDGQLADTYSVLAIFNTSRCSAYEDPKGSLGYGSLTTMCTIRVPVEINVVEKPMQSKATNLISGSTILLIVIATLLLIGVLMIIIKQIMRQREAVRAKWNEAQNKKISKYEHEMNKK